MQSIRTSHEARKGLVVVLAFGVTAGGCVVDSGPAPGSTDLATQVHGSCDTDAAATGSDAATPHDAASARDAATPRDATTGADAGHDAATDTGHDAATDAGHDAGAPDTGTSGAGFPDAHDTGVPAGTTLTHHAGNLVVRTAGTTVSNLDIDGSLTIDADHVTVVNCRVRCIGENNWCVSLDGGGNTVRDTEIGGGADGTTAGLATGLYSGTSAAGVNTLTRVHIHHTSDGLRIDGNTTIEDSYIHALNFCCGLHSDGSQTTGWSNIVFRHDTIEGGTNDAIFLKQESGNPAITHVTIDHNHLLGIRASGAVTSYGVGLAASVSGVSVTDNVFNRTFEVGPVSPPSGGAWAAFSGNTYEDGSPVAQP